MKKIFYLVLILISFLVAREILIPGLFFPMHDSTHIARLYFMDQNISQGIFPPIWADTANFGFGYPLLHFYAPFAYYIGLIIKTLVPSYLIALELTMVTLIFLAGFGMYTFMRKYGRHIALLSAAAFLLLPYMAINIYIRGALAELASMALLPWVFLAWRDLKKDYKSIIFVVLTSTFFVLSHNLIPLITFPFLIIWILINQLKNIRATLISSALTLGLSMFYILPLAFERGFVQVDSIAQTTDYSLHFVRPWQLWNSTWGFGGSAPGVEDGISFKVGKIQLLLATLSTFIIAKSKKNKELLFFTTLALVSAFLTTDYSRVVWDNITFLKIVQFPWRFLTLLGFSVAVLSGHVLSIIPKALRTLLTGSLIVALIFFNLKYFVPLLQSNYLDQDYLNDEKVSQTLALVVPEYLPSEMTIFPDEKPSGILVDSSDLVFQSTSQLNYHEIQYSSPRDLELTINKAYYPTWIATLDGITQTIKADHNGLITLSVPSGDHEIVLTQGHTSLEKRARAISFLTIISLLYLLVRKRKS